MWVFEDERATIRRYGIRLVVAILHILFGKTFYPQQLFEIWAIIFSSYFLSKLLLNMKLNKKITLTFGIVLLSIFFGENFRWLIGRGLTEFYSLFLISSSAFLFSIISKQRKLIPFISFYVVCLVS